MSAADVIDGFNSVYPDGDVEGQKNVFQDLNEQGCPLGGKGRNRGL